MARSSGHTPAPEQDMGNICEILAKYVKYGKIGETCGPAAVLLARGPGASACAVHAAELDDELVWRGALSAATPPLACLTHAADELVLTSSL